MWEKTSTRLKIFKLPGRKSLEMIMKTDRLAMLTPPEIINLWISHHKELIQYWGHAFSIEAYTFVRERLHASPYFCIPIFRDCGLFNVVTCFEQDLIGVAPLKEWQEQGDHCQPHMLIQFFPELSSSKKNCPGPCRTQRYHTAERGL